MRPHRNANPSPSPRRSARSSRASANCSIPLHPRLAERRWTQPPGQWQHHARSTANRHHGHACESAVDRPNPLLSGLLGQGPGFTITYALQLRTNGCLTSRSGPEKQPIATGLIRRPRPTSFLSRPGHRRRGAIEAGRHRRRAKPIPARCPGSGYGQVRPA